MKAFNMLRDGYTWRVGNGTDINIQMDKWAVERKLNDIIPQSQVDSTMDKQACLIDQNGDWDREKVLTLGNQVVVNASLAIPLSKCDNIQDSIIWSGSNTGTYTVASVRVW